MSVLSYFGLIRESLDPSPVDDFWYRPIAPANPSGVPVDEAVAMTYSACWAATRLYAGTIGMIPFNLYRSDGGGSEIAYDHPVYRLIHDEPNSDMSAMMFRSSRVNQQVNRGNCFAEIERSNGGAPVALWPIHAERIPRENVIRVGGRLVYLVNNSDGSKTPISQENMFHVASVISDDGVFGRGVVENARLTIGFGLATEKHGAAYFGNGARPGLIIKGAKFRKPEDAEEFRRQWLLTHGGPDNHGQPGILPPDADVTALPFNASDSQFLESRQHIVEEIARWYGVQPHLIGHLTRSTYSNIEHQGIEFVKYSLMPWLKLWEQEVWRKLLTKEEQKNYYAKFVVDALERGDKTSRTAASVQELFNGLLTLNQWAEREDMNPIGPLGDIHWTQQAMVPLEVAAKGPQPESAEPKEDRGELTAIRESVTALALGMLNSAYSKALSVEINGVKRIAEKASRFDARLKEFYAGHRSKMTSMLAEPLAQYAKLSGKQIQLEHLTQVHCTESLAMLDNCLDCQAEQLSARVEECVATWHNREVRYG